MRQTSPLWGALAIVLVAGLVVKFWWVLAIVAGAWVAYKFAQGFAARWRQIRLDRQAIGLRADSQHRAYLEGEPYGTYDDYPAHKTWARAIDAAPQPTQNGVPR